MAKSEQQRQKKLAKQKAKDRRKRQQIAQRKQSLASMAGKMAAASNGEIVGSYISETIDDGVGLGSVFFARKAPGGSIALGCFVVDLFCLGVKDCFGTYRNPSEYREMMDAQKQKSPLRKIEPEVLRGLVESSVEYAAKFGFAPHPDYRKISPLFGDLPSKSVEGIFEFGKDGKPVYVNGPHEDVAQQKLIIDKLTEAVGPDGFHFSLGNMGGGPQFLQDMIEEASFREYELLEDDDTEDEDTDSRNMVIDGNVVGRIDPPQ